MNYATKHRDNESIWERKEMFKKYRKGIEISTSDVHYGPLSPGEKELQLLGPTSELKEKKILEAGCGGAENCIALAKCGAECTGVDISPDMISYAQDLADKEGVSISLHKGDLKNLSFLPKSHFDIVISSYAIGFVHGITRVFTEISNCLKEGGDLVFCLTHPAQSPDGTNKLFIDEKDTSKDWVENLFPINHIVGELTNFNFIVQRIIEQITRNPSQLSEKERQKYPYRPKNLHPRFDKDSYLPHTIIYCASKV